MSSTLNKYRSQIDFHFYLPWVFLGILIILIAGFSAHWYILPLLGGPAGSLFGTYFNTSYTITNSGNLEVKSAAIPGRKSVIDIRSILSIEHINNKISAPALSRNRLEIFYNQTEKIYLSPQEDQKFIQELKKLNPTISLI